jgi:energy-converting hydrogenase Eha subunit C
VDLASTLFSTSWASGVNAYATVLLLNLLGRVGVGDVPDELEGNLVLAFAAVMFVIEFVTDKVPFLDSAWDGIHIVVRPAIAGAIGATYGSADELASLDQALATGGSATTALASAGVKTGLRLGINTSPEPASNIIVSLLEDGAVGVVVFLALSYPEVAAVIAAILLVCGIALVVFLWKRIRAGIDYVRERRRARGPGRGAPPAPPPP